MHNVNTLSCWYIEQINYLSDPLVYGQIYHISNGIQSRLKQELPDLGLLSLFRQEQSSRTEIYHFYEIVTGNPLKYKMDNSILILSTRMRNSIRIKRVN